MKTAAVVVVAIALAVGACKRSSAPAGLQLAAQPPAIGSRHTIDDTLDSTMNVVGEPGKTVELITHRVRSTQIEVRAVDAAGVVTAARAHYVAHHDEQRRDGVAQTRTNPVEGQSYLVSGDGATVAVVREDGSPITPEEQAAVTADLGRSIGKQPAISRLLLSHRWRAGELVTLTPEELQAAFAQNPTMKPTAGTALLVGVASGVATFEFDLTLTRDDPDGHAESPTRMTVKIDVARFRPVEMTMIGTIAGKVAGMETQGSMQGKVTYRYE